MSLEPDWKAGLDEEIMAFFGFFIGMILFPVTWVAVSFWVAFGSLVSFVLAGGLIGFIARKFLQR